TRSRCDSFFFRHTRRPPSSTLFPYTTLFRSSARKSNQFCPGLMRNRFDVPKRNQRIVFSGDNPFFAGVALKNSFPIFSAFHAFEDRKSTRLNSSHVSISYAVFCLKKKKN